MPSITNSQDQTLFWNAYYSATKLLLFSTLAYVMNLTIRLQLLYGKSVDFALIEYLLLMTLKKDFLIHEILGNFSSIIPLIG
jgi:hypothetical protein